MKIMVYKRTHNGDPDKYGYFGVHDCMGTFRNRDFDAIIGIGGIGREARAQKIDNKLNWIGIGPHRIGWERRGPILRFEHFCDFDTSGPNFRKLAPTLANRMYTENVRFVINLTKKEFSEALEVIKLCAGRRGRKRKKIGKFPQVPRTHLHCRHRENRAQAAQGKKGAS